MKKIFPLLFLVVFGYSVNSQEYTPLKATRHYMYSLNTGDNLTLGIPDFAWDERPEAGDEVGVFNSQGQLVGSAVFDGRHMAVAVWGDDETTKEKEGVSNGEKFSLKIWRAASGREDVLEVTSWLEGDEVFHSNGIAVVNKLRVVSSGHQVADYRLDSCFPNPVKTMARFEYAIPAKAFVDISLYTATGEFVRKLVGEEKPAGVYSVEFQALELASGNYYYRMSSGSFSATRYITISR